MPSVTSWRRLLLRVGAGFLLLVVLAFSYEAVRTVLALRAAKDETRQLTGEVRRGDVAAVRKTLHVIEVHSDTARGYSDNLLWDAFGEAPIVGDDIKAVQVIARALGEATDGASRPALTLLADLQDEQLRNQGGKVNLPAVVELTPSLEQLSVALGDASDQVDGIDSTNLIGPLGDITGNVQDQLETISSAVKGGVTVAHLMPAMLGQDGPRSYLLVVQNNAETRSTGGLPGSLQMLRVNDGKVTLGKQRAVDDFLVPKKPVLPLTREEQALYGETLGENIRDTNLTPDFPRAAELMRALTRRSFGTDVDGVVSVDPVALASILRATGPVRVGGETFDSGNVVRKLLNDVYLRFKTRERQDHYFDAVARGVFAHLITKHVEPLKLLRELDDAVDQRRFLVWSSHRDEEAELAAGRSGGRLPRDTGSVPQVGLYLNDGTGGKIEYYLQHSADIMSTACTHKGSQTLQVGMVLTSTAPSRAAKLPRLITGPGRFAPKGTTRINLRTYAPTGGRITRLTANKKPVRLVTHEHDGRQVSTLTMFIKPGMQVRLQATVLTRDGQRGDPELSWTPGVRTRTSGVTTPSSC